jgi:hypothetical protein
MDDSVATHFEVSVSPDLTTDMRRIQLEETAAVTATGWTMQTTVVSFHRTHTGSTSDSTQLR